MNHQRCVLHIWQNLGGELARQVGQAAQGLVGEAAEAARKQARKELVSLLHAVLDAQSTAAAESEGDSIDTRRLPVVP